MLIARILCLVALLANCLVSFFVEDDIKEGIAWAIAIVFYVLTTAFVYEAKMGSANGKI